MSQKVKLLSLVILDALIVFLMPYFALYIRFDGNIEQNYLTMWLNNALAYVMVPIVTFYFYGLYNRLWRYAGINELIAIASAVTVSSLIIISYLFMLGTNMPRSIYLLSWLFTLALVGGSRICVRLVHHFRQRHSSRNENVNVLIVGAGDAGAMLARELKHRYYSSKTLVGFIDDDVAKHNQMLMGSKVLGTRGDIQRIVVTHNVKEIFVALPSVTGALLREIVNDCKQTECVVKILPGLYELIDGQVTVKQLRDINLEDLLRRDAVNLDTEQIRNYLKNKRVLVTGAGGSIGSELCRQISKMAPQSLIIIGKGENSIYEIDRELRMNYSKLRIIPRIADIRDAETINDIFAELRPQVVFHAAAHKHVPLMEENPRAAVLNNVFGTKVVTEAADRAGSEVFVMISTDKAVNPTSIMGSTKRVAELLIQSMSKVSSTKFVAVRFGNVLGSRGSVVPLFKQQIAAGGPITITHPDMQRYFMTIPEATQLVLQAGSMAQGGEVFVLDMGEPVKIVDMACDLIELSGLVPHKDINIEYTGLRPGEKLFEEILTAEEGTRATKNQKIFIANLRQVDEAKLAQALVGLAKAKRRGEIVELLLQLVPTFRQNLQHSKPESGQLSKLGEQNNEQNIGIFQPVSRLQ
ncbi:MAG: nucleoside-diphosphate sugar epimerase/dehydratase [Sporomusaceae bacterium]|nr:nucleoside-diphosphate sugar epimerase/dehydratase [Sporomusaceae bacterium]